MRGITLFCARRAGLVLSVALCVQAACWWHASHLQIRGDFSELLPSESAAARRFHEAAERARGVASTLLVMIESPDPAQGKRIIDAFEAEVRALPSELLGGVEHGPGAARAYFEEQRWLFAEVGDLERISCELEAARARAIPGYVELDDPCVGVGPPETPATPGATSPLGGQVIPAQDPLERFEQRAEAQLRKYDRFPDGYYQSEDGRTFTLLIRSPSSGFGDRLGDRLFHAVQGVGKRIQTTLALPDSAIGYAGDIPTAIAERDALIDDLTIVSVIASLLILGSIATFFFARGMAANRGARRVLRATLYGLTALVMIGLSVFQGSSVAFALAMSAFGHLNAATSFLGAIIFGNGINYGVVYLARYSERRALGENVEQSLCDAAVTCAGATWLASVAAGGAYAALLLTSFRGFSEFGLIGAVGTVACWGATFVVCPAVTALVERTLGHVLRADLARVELPGRAPPTPLASLIARVTEIAPWPLLGLALTLCVAASIPLVDYLRDPWEYDFNRLRSASRDATAAGKWSRRSNEVFKTRGSPQLLLVDHIDQVLPAAAKVRECDVGSGQRWVDRVETVYDLLGGPPDVARRKLVLLGEIREHIDRLLPRIEAQGEREARRLAIARRWRPPGTLRELTPEDLPAPLRLRFTERDGRVGTPLFVVLDPSVSQSRGHNLLRISDVFECVRLPDGRPVPTAARAGVFAEMIRSMERDAPLATLFALLFVFAICIAVKRSVRFVVPVLGSLLCGVLWTVGGAAWFDVRLNFLNFVALPLTFGIGVEYAINLHERIRLEGGDVAAGIRSVAGAVMLCSLTTIFGYGALLFADNQALRSFGRYAIAGELACVSTALLIMPAALRVWKRRAGSTK